MEIAISVLVTVTANVIAYYVCKWLDDHDKGNE